jgi:hypothetical protein
MISLNSVLQMRPADQIVRHTMAIGATGFPDILVDLLTTLGYRWYPQYTVWELFREFNQELYRAVVRIYDRSNHSTNLLHTFDGYGVTEEMSVQEAAFVAITCLRGLNPLLETTPFGIFRMPLLAWRTGSTPLSVPRTRRVATTHVTWCGTLRRWTTLSERSLLS